MSESILKTTREFQWRQTNCACAFYCVKGQYIVFQPTTTAICRTCTVVIKKYGLPLVAFTNTKSWHDPPLEILPVAPGHQQPPNIGLLSRDCWWTVATLEAPGILNNYFSTNQMSSTMTTLYAITGGGKSIDGCTLCTSGWHTETLKTADQGSPSPPVTLNEIWCMSISCL